MKLSTNAISIAGEFAVLSQLALRGIDANLALGHTKSVDILASDPETGRMFRIEVKTSYNNRPATSKLFGHTLDGVVSAKNESIIDSSLFYCFVRISQETNIFTYYIVPSAIVARYVREQHQFWLNQNNHRQAKSEDSAIRRFRLGLDDGGYLIDTPLARDYENNWDVLLRQG